MKKVFQHGLSSSQRSLAKNIFFGKQSFFQSSLSHNHRGFSISNALNDKKRILFFGSDDFSLNTLKLVHSEFVKNDLANIYVVCPPDRKAIRRNSITNIECVVKTFCKENNVPFVHPIEKYQTPEERKKIQRLDLQDIPKDPLLFGENNHDFTPKFDLGIVVSFSYFLQSGLLNQFKSPDGRNSNIFNIHPSLLPRYRGPAPIHHALLNGDTETGITIIELDDKEFDVGHIVKQKRFPIEPTETFTQLHDRLSKSGAEMIVEMIEECNFNFSMLKRMNQADMTDTIKPTRARKVNFDMGELDFMKEDVLAIYNKWRALEKIHVPFHDRCHESKLILKNISYPIMDEAVPSHDIGTLFIDNTNSLWLQCKGGKLKINILQIEKKTEMNSKDFVNGNKSKLPMKL
ncbi:hypothetical protein C9374_007326 [Naegleria lovaniensis]|uniref:methionyl-tRNA formyltransferase n=1 Tax=Naegleria lovaniensis TaxID=51637 RepID=A0AA88GKR5_NAELO|nr:uncharacterized protein C9374_007326 [Naegleria lovaniensis]KAG2379187.1 hypothetical protein C9374_007326 [Naegleria lovaniensis]